jgi:hypothetical protein
VSSIIFDGQRGLFAAALESLVCFGACRLELFFVMSKPVIVMAKLKFGFGDSAFTELLAFFEDAIDGPKRVALRMKMRTKIEIKTKETSHRCSVFHLRPTRSGMAGTTNFLPSRIRTIALAVDSS